MMMWAVIAGLGLLSGTFAIWFSRQSDGASVLIAARFPALIQSVLTGIIDLLPKMKMPIILGCVFVGLGYGYQHFSKYFGVSRVYFHEAAAYCSSRSACAEYGNMREACSSSDDVVRCLYGRLGVSRVQRDNFVCRPDGTIRVESQYSSLSEQDCAIYSAMDRILPGY